MASKLVKAVFCGSIMIHKYTLDRSINGSDGQIKTLISGGLLKSLEILL